MLGPDSAPQDLFLEQTLPRLEPSPLNKLSQLLCGVSTVVLDLDYLLVIPNGTHREVFVETVKSLGGDAETAIEAFIRNRGIDYLTLMKRIYEECGGFDQLRCNFEQFSSCLADVASDLKCGNEKSKAYPLPCAGAEILLKQITEIGIDFMVCTDSLRAIAELEIELSGLSRYLPANKLFCCDDVQLGKCNPNYGSKVFSGKELSTMLGFEDRPLPAAAMLTAGMGRMVLCPSREREGEEVQNLKAVHGERLIVVHSL